MSPEESKKRLRVLAKKMDINKDGFVDKNELTDWVYNSLLLLDEEETRERFEEVDTGKSISFLFMFKLFLFMLKLFLSRQERKDNVGRVHDRVFWSERCERTGCGI